MSASSSRFSTPLENVKPTSSSNHIAHAAHKLLTRAHPSDPDIVSKIFTDKILNKPLLLSKSTDHVDKRAFRRHIRDRKASYSRKHARPKPLSAKEKRALKLYEIKPEECRYEVYRGLNLMWRRYVLEVLGYLDREGQVVAGKVGTTVTANGAGALMTSADYHGMEIEVVRSVDQGRVGAKGIVVRETRSTFVVVMNERERSSTRREEGGSDKVRTLLKKGSVFRVVIDLPKQGGVQAAEEGEIEQETKRQLIFELHGDQLEIRPIERATKKFKWKPMKYL